MTRTHEGSVAVVKPAADSGGIGVLLQAGTDALITTLTPARAQAIS